MPPSVRDAVLAELGRVGPAARELAQCVSLFPGRAERALLSALTATDACIVAECLRSGLLVELGSALAFRHEIARNAVHDSLSAHRRIEGHAAIHRALSELPGAQADVARRVHHAEAAGLDTAVNALAPEAARQAAAAGDHHEAARLYGLALREADGLDPPTCAGLLEAQARECLLINRHRASIWCLERALAIHRSRDDRLRIGVALRELARLCWYEQGSSPASERLAHEAIEMLEALPAGRELALAYSTLSHLRLVGEDMPGAQAWGLRAIELAEAVDDPKALCHALNNVGTARLRVHADPSAFGRLQRSLALALEHGLDQDAARAYNNLFILCIVHHDFAAGLRHAEEGIAFCESRGLDVFNVRIRIRRAFARIVMGQWPEARRDLDHVALQHLPSPMEAATLDFVAALLALRRGDAGAGARLAAAVARMTGHRVEIWFISTAAALAEAAWLAGEDEAVSAVAVPALARLAAIGDRWRCGELAAWLARSGVRVPCELPDLPLPYQLELDGRWRAAAQEWNRLGCPYASGLALAGGGEEELHEAQLIFERLGAEPAVERVRALLRQRGARRVRRGPQPRTRGDPLGLTARERQVFELARQGLTNAGIAGRLHRSERTVEHHVAAVLHKLGVDNRVALIAHHGAAPK
jgi:DNA-binding CsgD family transcriptional regulator